MPTREALEEYYSRYYQQNELGVTFVGKQAFAKNIAKRCTPRRILDFGGGDGSLSKAISPTAEIVVVDYAAPTGDSRVTLLKELSEASGSFDLVIASAVLEHVPEIRITMERLFRLVAPRGLFYARTPYVQPFASFGRVDVGFPGHLHDLGPDFWNRVIETFQLQAVLEASRPSIVETSFASHPVRTLAAYALKAPCHLELLFHRNPWWRFVGGWEVFLRFR
ncbi:MAG: class I SAM-dependent methyltransferase [Myxococcales bacterium]|nr:class I SAM-dependent methyltransferase [Myxococcales bacterium]